MCIAAPDYCNHPHQQEGCIPDARTSEQIMVDMVREDLGVTLSPQAWRIFLRHRWGRFSTLAHRIHEGKR